MSRSTWPIFASTFAMSQPFLTMHVDTYFAGELGVVHVGALGVAITSLGTWTWIVTAPIWAFSVQVGRSAARPEVVRRYLATSLVLTTGLGCTVGVLLGSFTGILLDVSGGDFQQIQLATPYHALMSFALPITAVFFLSIRVLLSLNRYTEVFYLASLAFLINTLGNTLAIYGFQMGLAGLAVSAIASQCLTAFLGLVLAYNKGSNAEAKADNAIDERRQTASLVIYSLLGNILVTTAYLILGRICNQLGSIEAAAHAKAYTLFLSFSYITSGLVNVTETKGYALRFNSTEYCEYRSNQIFASLKIGCFVAVAYVVPAYFIFAFSDGEVAEVLYPLFLISAAIQVPTTVLWSLFALLRSQAMFGQTLLIESGSTFAFLAVASAANATTSAWHIWTIFSVYLLSRLGIALYFTHINSHRTEQSLVS